MLKMSEQMGIAGAALDLIGLFTGPIGWFYIAPIGVALGLGSVFGAGLASARGWEGDKLAAQAEKIQQQINGQAWPNEVQSQVTRIQVFWEGYKFTGFTRETERQVPLSWCCLWPPPGGSDPNTDPNNPNRPMPPAQARPPG